MPAEKILVDIVSVMWDAVRRPATALHAGAWVFDSTGGRHKIANVRVIQKGKTVSFKREDYPYRELIGVDDLITFVPAHGWSDVGMRYRSWVDPITHVNLGAFNETCRCGQVFELGPDDDGSGARQLLADHANQLNGIGEVY